MLKRKKNMSLNGRDRIRLFYPPYDREGDELNHLLYFFKGAFLL